MSHTHHLIPRHGSKHHQCLSQCYRLWLSHGLNRVDAVGMATAWSSPAASGARRLCRPLHDSLSQPARLVPAMKIQDLSLAQSIKPLDISAGYLSGCIIPAREVSRRRDWRRESAVLRAKTQDKRNT